MKWRIPVLMAAGALGGYLGFLVADRELPLQILDMKPTVERVSPGDTLRVQYQVFRYRDCRMHVTRLIFDSERTMHVIAELDLPSGLPLGNDFLTTPVPVPLTATKGPAKYRIIVSYACNPLQRLWPLVAPPREVSFEII